MKKLALMAIAAIATTTMSFGALTDSAHDFTGGPEDAWNTTGEMCRPCHTPHNALNANSNLWNHEESGGGWTL